MADDSQAHFGFPQLWNDAFKAHENIYRAIDKVQAVANELIAATATDPSELVEIMRGLTAASLNSVTDVLILAGNGRGIGGMKIARSMFEVSITAEYLQKRPQEVGLFLDFAHVIGWRYLQQMDAKSRGRIPTNLMREGEAEYNRVKGKFENSKRRVRNNWTAKTVKDLANDVGRSDLYELVYSLSSMLHHVNVGGLIGHDMKWESEALRIAHGALLQTIASLHNARRASGTDSFGKIQALDEEFQKVWKEHVA